MAGRFVFQKLASGMMLRSADRLRAHAPASSSATALGARYLNTFPGFREAAKSGWSKIGMQGSVGGVKPTCSPGACDKVQLADWIARVKAWWAHKKPISFDQVDMNILLSVVLVAVCIVPLPSDVKSSHKAPIRHCSGVAATASAAVQNPSKVPWNQECKLHQASVVSFVYFIRDE